MMNHHLFTGITPEVYNIRTVVMGEQQFTLLVQKEQQKDFVLIILRVNVD